MNLDRLPEDLEVLTLGEFLHQWIRLVMSVPTLTAIFRGISSSPAYFQAWEATSHGYIPLDTNVTTPALKTSSSPTISL
jgi:hypothetical protein